ncbi:IQ motif-containing protein H [Polymixia lowei]
MSETLENEDELGKILVQVQDDLRQLKHSLDRLTISERGETLDLQALDAAICRTESGIRKRAEQYLKTVNKKLLVLPSIEDLKRKAVHIPKWKPPVESITDLRCQRGGFGGVSPGEKVTHHRVIRGPTVGLLYAVPGRNHSKRYLARPEEDIGAGLTDRKSRCHGQLTWGEELGPTRERIGREGTPTLTTKAPAPPPSPTSKSSGHSSMTQSGNCPAPERPQNLPVLVPVAISKFPFTITEGRIDPTAVDFCRFKQHYCFCWGTLVDALDDLEKLLREFAVPLARVNGERLADYGQGGGIGWNRAAPPMGLLSALDNREEVLDLVLHPGQRYKGEGGIEAAAIRIQSCWRRYLAWTAYLRLRRRKWAAETIAIIWLMHAQMGRVRKALQARRFRQLENYRSRAQHLAANWKHIQSSKRTIIHIPSLGYSQIQRFSLKGFDILQNIQISRLCDVRDENVEVIYVSPLHLGNDINHYYTSLLKLHGATEVGDAGPAQSSNCLKRFTILTPEALEYFPTHNMCLSTLLKYSPRTLQRIKNLIQGKQAYIVGGVAHVDDLAVADELGVPVLGPEPAIAQLYGTKSGGRRIFTGAEVDVPPGQGDIYFLNQLHETLARLMTQNMDVQRWLFKMDPELGGRGTAYCDVCHLSCYSWALQEYHRLGPDLWSTEWAQEPVMLKYLDEVPEWLAYHAQPAKTSCYPNWACFLKTFLRQGGVVEAYPPSDSVTCLTVDLLLEPGGEVTMLSCGDQLHGSSKLESIGSTVPQTSVCPDALRSICTRVGQACLQRLIIGYVSLDLATFLDHSTLEQKVWTIDMDLRYSEQLAMTQMLLIVTGGTLDCHACHLEVPVPVKEKTCEHQTAAKPPVAYRYAVIGNRLLHTNLSMVYHNVFFKMCKAQGIGFDIKKREGTVFALHDSSERYSLGMVTVSEDLQGALVTFAQNLSVIHQEISSPKMQGESNFKDLIKDIEDVLRTTAQNKVQAGRITNLRLELN